MTFGLDSPQPRRIICTMFRLFIAVVTFTLSSQASAQHVLPTEPLPGDEYQITVQHSFESKSETSSSSSSGGHEYVERILAVRSNGIEIEYDLPLDPDDDERLIEWHFPVRVFDATTGEITLLNRDEMEARRDLWLEKAKISPKACGSWYFTWNAFQVDCDPESVLPTLASFELQPEELSAGASFRSAGALQAGQLALETSTAVGSTFSVRMPVDPDALVRENARSDVVVGEIMGDQISFEAAYANRAKEQITGTIKVVLETDPNDQVWRRSETTELNVVLADGTVETSTSRHIVERKLISRGSTEAN